MSVEEKGVENLIEKSFDDLVKALTNNGSFGQLIFPKTRNKSERYSEQELKQIFLEHVNGKKIYFYSVETPTEYFYCFKNSENPTVKENHEKGDNHKAARFDVSLYNNKYELLNHIEFKYGNPKKKGPICKDFLKLAKEVKLTNEKKSFFVHYLNIEKENAWESSKFQKLFENYRKSVDEIENKIEDKNDLSKVIVYLVCIHGKGKTASTYHFSLADLKNNYTVGTKYSDLTDKSWFNEKIFNTEHSI